MEIKKQDQKGRGNQQDQETHKMDSGKNQKEQEHTDKSIGVSTGFGPLDDEDMPASFGKAHGMDEEEEDDDENENGNLKTGVR